MTKNEKILRKALELAVYDGVNCTYGNAIRRLKMFSKKKVMTQYNIVLDGYLRRAKEALK